MKKYEVQVCWEMCGYINVEANSLEEAMDKVKENPDDYHLPSEQNYVDKSFRLVTEYIDEMKIISAF